MTLRTFTLLCYHHYYSSINLFMLQNWNSVPLNNISLFFPSPCPRQPPFYFYLCGNLCWALWSLRFGWQCLPTLCEISEFLIFHFPCNSLSSLVELHLTHAYFSIQQKLKGTPFQTSRTLSTKFLPFWNIALWLLAI